MQLSPSCDNRHLRRSRLGYERNSVELVSRGTYAVEAPAAATFDWYGNIHFSDEFLASIERFDRNIPDAEDHLVAAPFSPLLSEPGIGDFRRSTNFEFGEEFFVHEPIQMAFADIEFEDCLDPWFEDFDFGDFI
jgi:hypothetical protein